VEPRQRSLRSSVTTAFSVDPPRLQRARGEGRIVAASREGRTEIVELYQDGCAKIRLPHTHNDSLQAVLMNTAGGLTDGDHVRWSARAGEGAHLTLTTPTCERIYRSLGADARIDTTLAAEAGAHLDWLPQETILFEGGRLDRRLEIDLAETATLTAVEAVLIGRQAMGETAPAACLRDTWRIRRGGKLIHAEATVLSADPRERASRSLLAGALAFATVLHVSPAAERRLDAVRALLPETGGASVIADRLTVRLLAPNGLALRRALAPIIGLLSSAGSVPRLWSL
jgi:urease accessory protein